MNARSTLCTLIVAALMLITSFSAIECLTPDASTEQPQRARTMAPPFHANISIRYDEGFLASNITTGISWGSGTPSDPYIIENWSIRFSLIDGIRTYSTLKHLIIRNCHLYDNGEFGIALYGSDNVDVLNCTIYNNDIGGIYLDSAYHCNLSNNSIFNNRRDNVHIFRSHGSVISGNNISTADWDGLKVVGEYGHDIVGNDFYMNKRNGVNVSDSNGDTLTGNSLLKNNRAGIRFTSTGNSTIDGNNCSNNFDGISISGSGNNVISNNTCYDNAYYGPGIGLSIYHSSNNNLSRNDCIHNCHAIQIDSSNDTCLFSNNCLNSSGIGIYLMSSGNYSISGNNCSNNIMSGIYLQYSEGGIVSSNTCTNNTHYTGHPNGIEVALTNNVLICSNDCSYNGYDGISVHGNNITLSNNHFKNNEESGMEMILSDNNTVSFNDYSNNGQFGIFLGSSRNCTFFDNTISGNGVQGLLLYDAISNDNTIWNNTFFHNNGAMDVYDPSHIQASDETGPNNQWNSSNGYGNWWSDWRTPDALPPWGIVDHPYAISGSAGAKDLYPRTGSCPVTSPTTNPIYYTGTASIDLGGTADGIGISSVGWENSATGDSGTAVGVFDWSISGIALNEGSNPITISIIDPAGFVSDYTFNVVRDSAAPTCTIKTPTPLLTYQTESPTFSIGGTAYDSGAVVTVAWKNMATGASGTASGTTAWSVTGITLVEGSNLIYVNVTDGMGRTGSDSVTVTYTPPPPPELNVTGVVTPTSGTAPLLVTFSLSSTGGVQPFTFLWDFGDGSNSTESNPSHLYNTSGYYKVTLTVTDNASQTSTWNTTVTVSAEGGGGGGFDLMSLIVILMIIAIIVAIAIPSIFGMRRKAKEADSRAAIKDIGTSVAQMEDDVKKVEPAKEKPADGSKVDTRKWYEPGEKKKVEPSPPKPADNTKINVSGEGEGEKKKVEPAKEKPADNSKLTGSTDPGPKKDSGLPPAAPDDKTKIDVSGGNSGQKKVEPAPQKPADNTKINVSGEENKPKKKGLP